MSNLLTAKEEAYVIHHRIIANGKILQTALYEVCKDLKLMRDDKLYAEMGYSTFEEYAEQACGIKQRQAYAYIATYEKLGEDFLKDNARLGITKLELISQVSSYEREEFLQENNVNEASVRELKAMVDDYKKQTEQLTFEVNVAKEQLDTALGDAAGVNSYNEKLEERIEKLQAELEAERKSKEIVVEPVEKSEKIKEALEIQRKKYEAQMAKNFENAEKQKQEAVNIAKKEAKKETLEKVSKKIDELTKGKKLADEKLEKLIKESKISNADEDALAIRFLFSNLQSTANDILSHLKNIKLKDESQAQKLNTAMLSVIEGIINSLKEIQK